MTRKRSSASSEHGDLMTDHDVSLPGPQYKGGAEHNGVVSPMKRHRMVADDLDPNLFEDDDGYGSPLWEVNCVRSVKIYFMFAFASEFLACSLTTRK